MRQEQQKRELVLVELGGLSQVSERRRLIGGTCLSSLHEVAACAPAFRNLLAVVSIRRSGCYPANSKRDTSDMVRRSVGSGVGYKRFRPSENILWSGVSPDLGPPKIELSGHPRAAAGAMPRADQGLVRVLCGRPFLGFRPYDGKSAGSILKRSA